MSILGVPIPPRWMVCVRTLVARKPGKGLGGRNSWIQNAYGQRSRRGKCACCPLSTAPNQWYGIPRGLRVYSNSEYVYAIFPIAVALFWDQWGRDISNSEALATIFTILAHCLNASAINNYFTRTHGQLSCLGAMLKGPPPIGPLDDFSEFPHVPIPTLTTEAAQKSCYLSLSALALSTRRFGKMSWVSADGHLELSALDNLPIQVQRQGFRTVDLLDAFVKSDGSQIDRDARSSPDCDLKADLLSGRV